MARQVKRFGEHSQRWQKEARAQGISPTKWNKWRRLSESTRKATNPTDYAKGKTVATFRTEQKQQAVYDSLAAVHKDKPKFRPRGLRQSIAKMTVDQMNKILSFKTTSTLADFIEGQLRLVRRGDDSIFFYQ